jgi:MFS transporter, NNP family, nitrate/nitrite transporter
MLTRGNPEYAEEDYYLQEWSAEEVSQGLHQGSMKFAMESRSQRGARGAAALTKANSMVSFNNPAAEGKAADSPTSSVTKV